MAKFLLILTVGLMAASPQGWSEEAPDWPTVISRLQQQVYDHPGLAQARQQLAIAYNNYGVQLGETSQWDLAARQLQEALRLEADNQQFRQNLANIRMHQAQEAYQQHQLTDAIRWLDEVERLDSRQASAYVLRGEIEYDRQKLKEAKVAWERALALGASDPELPKRLKQLNQELPVESKFERLSQASFDLRYEEEVERPVGFDIRDALSEARRAVGSDFAYWPKHKLVVLIYSAESFRQLRQETPDWVAGQFDGKIRVPLPSAQLNSATVRQILFHEYTHALIHDLTSGHCPTWLNEGLAEYEGRTQMPGDLTLLRQTYEAQQLFPWLELSDQFASSLPAQHVGLAYQESYSIVAYLAARRGFWRFRRLLKAIGGGAAWPEAMEAEYHLKFKRLQEVWLAWLPELLKQ